jgi:hypothetical protein
MPSVEALAVALGMAILAALLPDSPAGPQNGRRDASWLLYGTAAFMVVGSIAVLTLQISHYRSLWLDEFGTLWVIRAPLEEVATRVYEFHGQSPLYYYLPWTSVRLLGETQLALRVPSLVALLLASIVVGTTAAAWYGRNTFAPAMLFVWCPAPILGAAIDARPYGLALAAFACAWLGFSRATGGAAYGRPVFVLGALLLFWTHYLLALSIVGVVTAYAALPALRLHYPVRRMVADLGLIALFSAPGLPHLYDLWTRREALDWVASRHHSAWLVLVLPSLLVLALALAVRSRARVSTNPRLHAPLIAAAVPIMLVYAMSVAGLNVLAPRYLLPVAISAILLAAGLLSTLTPRLRRSATAVFVGSAFFGPLMTGSLAVGVFQDWTAVRAILDEARAADPRMTLLFRSGFVEQDARSVLTLSPVDVAPLQPPGFLPYEGRVVPLTFTWSAEAIERIDATAVPALGAGATVLVVSTRYYSGRTGEYGTLVARRIARQRPGVRVDAVDCCPGIDIIKVSEGDGAAAPSEDGPACATRR